MSKSMFLSLGVLLCLVTSALAATLESPANGATLSGLGSIYGWKCNAGTITVRINDDPPMRVATGMPRADVRSVCGSINHGFIIQTNWALLGDGKHQIAAYDNGVKFASATFTVATLGEEYLRGAEGEYTLRNFPSQGEDVTVKWEESTQHFEVIEADEEPDPEPPAQSGVRALLGSWRFTSSRATHTWIFTDTYVSSRNGKTYARGGTGLIRQFNFKLGRLKLLSH